MEIKKATFFEVINKSIIYKLNKLKNSASMSDGSGSQFLRTTTRIQSVTYVFDESRPFMTFLTTFEVIWA